MRRWTSDAYLAVGDYDNAWAYRKPPSVYFPPMRLFDLLAIRSKCTDTIIDGEGILELLGGPVGLTPFGTARMPEIITRATRRLEILHQQHGKNFVDYFVHQFDFSNLTETDMEHLKQCFSDEKDFEFWRKLYFKDKELRRRRESEPYKVGPPAIRLFENVPSKHNQSSVTLTMHVGGSGGEARNDHPPQPRVAGKCACYPH